MNAKIDHDLTPDQWEALKALRTPAAKRRVVNRFVVEQLVALRLATETDDGPAITPEGRSVLLRGSPRLWDVAA
jgi:ribosomal protein S19E (S16A)